MKRFKMLDCWTSLLLIVACIIYSILPTSQDGFEKVITSYFIVGGWQVISMIIHAANKWFTADRDARYYYHWLVSSIFMLALVGVAVTAILVFLMYTLMFAAPFMAIYYTWLCFNEVYVKMQRPLAILK